MTVEGHAGVDPLGDPRWFAEGFDATGGEFRFVATDRATLAAQSFLDMRWDRSGAARTRASVATLAARLPVAMPWPAFIWHTGLCCSTLLARALDFAGRNLSLCEPQILVEIADAKRAGLLSRAAPAAAPQLAFHLLARGFANGERVTIKPAPAANNLLREAAGQTARPMLFLYSDCRSFLVSIIRLGEEGRKYVRRLFVALLADGHPQAQWPPVRLLALSDLELAALVWHMQMAEFTRAWPLLGTGRAASLDCDALLAAPLDALHRIDAFFSLDLGSDHLDRLVAGPLFRRNAKTGEDSFDANRRRAEYARIGENMAADLDRIVAQSYSVCRTTPHGVPLPGALLSIAKSYGP